MIAEARNIQPYIEFENGFTEVTPVKGVPVTVWLNTLFNTGMYTFDLVSDGIIEKVSDYEYRVTISTIGEHNVYLNVIAKDKHTVLKSNELTIIIQ